MRCGIARSSGAGYSVIGEGTNLIVSDAGFDGIVLRFTANNHFERGANSTRRSRSGTASSGRLFDRSRPAGASKPMTGIPGIGGRGRLRKRGRLRAFHRRTSGRVGSSTAMQCAVFTAPECRFRYRESIFKDHKHWIILSVELRMTPAPVAELRETAETSSRVRLAKYPAGMKCAGQHLQEPDPGRTSGESLPPADPRACDSRRKGPVCVFPGAGGRQGNARGGLRVADYHANLIYNSGGGSASELCELILELKLRVRYRFGLELEEEVQYVGFSSAAD